MGLKKDYRKVLNRNKELIQIKKNLNAEIQSMQKRFKACKFNHKKLDKQYDLLCEEYKTIKKKYHELQDKIY